MISYRTKIQETRLKNIVCFLTQAEDIALLDFLSLDEVFLENMKKALTSKEMLLQEYFLGQKRYEKLFVFILKDQNEEEKTIFLGKHFPKLPDDLFLLASDIEEKKNILKVCELSRYLFQIYKTKKIVRNTEILCTKLEKNELLETQALLENIFLARDLGEIPACELTPEIFAQKVKNTKFKNVKVKVLTFKEIQKKKLWFIEAVGKGSINKPCMVILEHIRNKKKPTLGIVGKGVTFDTGGNQIKPGDHMYEMKGDMGWAAVSYALMKELDRHNIDKNIVVCLVLAENVISSNSYKPSDIIRWYTGKTVEVIHTDAEGRLVLADGMSYLWKNYKTSSMMTIATLTWACIMALGHRYAGVMGTDEVMIENILEYSKNHTEKYVRLPLDTLFIEKTKSEIADYKNLDRSVFAGSSMGAAFLSNFLENEESYTHLDIAGTYINMGEAYGKMPRWMTGFWVESLSELLRV